mmetsp:Transcript_19865/g.25691  ORF Transcript_19865/g.25691 Transcript_19865/m.25691 type:complete len:95 (+) Transcript_19865:2-286(+)
MKSTFFGLRSSLILIEFLQEFQLTIKESRTSETLQDFHKENPIAVWALRSKRESALKMLQAGEISFQDTLHQDTGAKELAFEFLPKPSMQSQSV